jgi:hypothetical protein
MLMNAARHQHLRFGLHLAFLAFFLQGERKSYIPLMPASNPIHFITWVMQTCSLMYKQEQIGRRIQEDQWSGSQGERKNFFVGQQGDQIGRILAYWVIVHFGSFFKNS